MHKRAVYIALPLLLLMLCGLWLLLRPHAPVQVIEVVDAYTRQQKTSARSTHRKTVHYSVVRVEYQGRVEEVAVHDNFYLPLKAGDTVIVARRLTGGLTEYRSESGMACLGAGAPGLVLLVLYAIFARRRQAHS